MSSSVLKRNASKLPRSSAASAVRRARWPAARPACRHASSLSSWVHSNSRISSVFGALIALGVGATAYGIYEFYSTFTMWPKEVRSDLRAGIKARNQGDLDLSERYLHRAWETAQTLPLEMFAPNPYLKLSGIAIVLAEVLEANNKPQLAYETYVAAFNQLQEAKNLWGPEKVRKAAIAYKLGGMAEQYQQPEEEEEKWLVFAVEELLRVVGDTQGVSADDGEQKLELSSELQLPPWVEKASIVASMEALGSFYNRTGKQGYAIPLYLSALSILMPKDRPTTEQRCQGAQIMNSIADSLISASPTPERRDQAEAWVKKALSVIELARNSAKEGDEALEHCEGVFVAALFNLGSLREMAGDLEASREHFKASRQQAIDVGMREGIIQAEAALRRLERSKNNPNTQSATQK